MDCSVEPMEELSTRWVFQGVYGPIQLCFMDEVGWRCTNSSSDGTFSNTRSLESLIVEHFHLNSIFSLQSHCEQKGHVNKQILQQNRMNKSRVLRVYWPRLIATAQVRFYLGKWHKKILKCDDHTSVYPRDLSVVDRKFQRGVAKPKERWSQTADQVEKNPRIVVGVLRSRRRLLEVPVGLKPAIIGWG